MSSKLIIVGSTLLALAGCGDNFSSNTAQGGSGTGAASGAGGAGGGQGGAAQGGAGGSTVVSEIGCSDGSRESYVLASTHPDSAGCAGAWNVPGVMSPESKLPQCARQAGNDGVNAKGDGCSVEDLCAEGWHVCTSAVELTNLGITCGMVSGLDGSFWLTRQSQNNSGSCSADGMNNIIGCGNVLGAPANSTCAPLNRAMRHTDCASTTTWSCGDAAAEYSEAAEVTKNGGAEGGVLCCRIADFNG